MCFDFMSRIDRFLNVLGGEQLNWETYSKFEKKVSQSGFMGFKSHFEGKKGNP